MTDESGLINLRARTYDPGSGRFLTMDSWGGDHQNPITLVKWVYANANPVRYTDPSGYCYTDPNIFSAGFWTRFWDSPFLGPCSASTGGETVGNSESTCTPTVFPTQTATSTPTISPNTYLATDDERAAAFLMAVNNHQRELLDIHFSISLFLAMGTAETGPYSHWNNDNDGIMQVEHYNQETLPYGNTLQGIDNNVKDAIKLLTTYINTNSLIVFTEEQFEKIKYLPFDDSNLNYYRQCKAVLMYNGGYDPIGVYNRNQGNSQYVGTVADTLDYYVPSIFGNQYHDDNLVEDLRTFLSIFNTFLE